MKVQRLVRKPGAGKTDNAPSRILSDPTTTFLDKSPVCSAVHHITLRQPGQCRPADKSLGCRSLDAWQPLNVALKGRADKHESLLSF